MCGRLGFTLAFLSSLAVSTGAITIDGTVFTENAAGKARVTVWAIGDAVVADPTLALEPSARVAVVPGEPFALEFEVEPPFRVEASAEGHVTAALEVLFPEQLHLPPVWLPSGKTRRLVVTSGDGPASAAVIGATPGERRVEDPFAGHWTRRSTAVTGRDGTAALVLPDDSGAFIQVLGRDGRWATQSFEAPLPDELRVRLDSIPFSVRVLDGRGRPAVGALLAVEEAPVGATAMTGEDGTALVQAVVGGPWALAIRSSEGVTRRLFRGAPSGRIEVVTMPLHEVKVRWTGAADAALYARWLPQAFSGGAPILASGGEVRLPLLGRGGTMTVWAPGREMAQVSVDEPVPIAVALAPSPRIRGILLGPGDEPVAASPVWSWQVPPRVRAIMRRYGQSGLERAQRMSLPWAVTDAQGRFTILDLVTGPHRLTAVAPGFPAAESEDLVLEPGAMTEVTLRAVEGTTVSAKIVDPDGVPITGVTASATVNRLQRGGMVFRFGPDEEEAPVASAVSNEDGRVVLAGVPSRLLKIALERPSFVSRIIDVEVPVEGKALGEVVMEPGVSVQGRVIDRQGNGVADALVSAGAEGVFFATPEARADAQGYFVLEDRPATGELILEARADGYVPLKPTKVVMPPVGLVEVRVREALDLEGRVADRETADAVAGAELALTQQVERVGPGGSVAMQMMRSVATAESAEDGTFTFPDLAPGEYTVNAKAAPYQSRRLPVTVPEDEAPEQLTVLLDTGLVISGEVVDGSGAAAPGIDVTVAAAESSRGGGAPGRSAKRTDDIGAFRVEGLAPGRYEVTARAEGGRTAREVVEAGKEQVRLELLLPGRIEGRVVDDDGGPIAAAEVFALGPDRASATSGADGSFRFATLPAGGYRLISTAEGWSSDSVEVTVEEGRAVEAELTLKHGGTVLGRIIGLSTVDLEKCTVYGGYAHTAPAPDGSFRLTGVRPGPVEVTASLLLAQRGRSARTVVEADGPPAEVEIDFTAGASLSGTVRRQGRGVAGITVNAGSASGHGTASTITGERGEWDVSGLEPGEIEVTVADGRGRVLSGRTVTVTDHARVDLEIPGGELDGRVVEADTRRPVPGAEVSAIVEGPPRAERNALSEEDGRFRLGNLPDGIVAVRARAAGYMPGEASTAVSMGQAPDVVLELRPEQGLDLILREADGLPGDQVYVLPMRGGRVEEPVWTQCDREGRARITTLPAGDYVLSLQGRGSAIIRTGVPGPERAVVLQPTGTLDVFTPGGDGWRVLLVTADGLPVPQHPYRSPTRDGWLDGSSGRVAQRLPAGAYTVRATGPGGSRSASVVVPPYGEAIVNLD